MELHLSDPVDGGQTYRELRRQLHNFRPPDTTFEREDRAVNAEGMTHRRPVIRPDNGATPVGPRSPRRT
jgi:hypothetical protein